MKRYTRYELNYIKEHYLHKTNKQIADALNRTEPSVSYQLVKLKLKRPRRIWTAKELELLKLNAATMSYTQLAKALRATPQQVIAALKNHKLCPGKKPYFAPGHTPWNKGMKGLCTGGQNGYFKKGIVPHNTKTDGAISIRRDKRGNMYKYIRLSKANWVQYHRYLWMQAYGSIPAKMVVTFKDGNSLNCTLENLKLITTAENMKRCGHTETALVKRSATMKDIWYKEKLRQVYGLGPKTGLGKRLRKTQHA
jgi:hypothetical protein